MKTAILATALGLVLLASASPTTEALRLEVPLAALVVIELPENSGPDARPRTTVAPGWACEDNIWARQFEFTLFETLCQPTVEEEVVDEWTCRNPVVYAEGTGVGTLTGTAYCDGVSASCIAHIVGYNFCTTMTVGSGSPPLRCRAEISGFLTSWRVVCHNDP